MKIPWGSIMKPAAYISSIFIFLFVLAAPIAVEAAPPAKVDQKREEKVRTAPVTLGGSPIFAVEGWNVLPAEERATRIGGRISEFADDYSIGTDTIRTVDTDITTDIVAGERLLMSVTDRDAAAAGLARQQLAGDIAGRIRVVVESYREARAPGTIMHGVIMCAGATLVLLALLFMVRFVFRRLTGAVDSYAARSIRIQNFEVLRSDQVKRLVTSGISGLRLLVVLLLIYIYVQFVLGSFPWTKSLSGELLRYLLVPLRTMAGGVADYSPNMIFLVVLAVITRYLIKFMRLFSEEVARGSITFPHFYPDWALPTYRIARFAVIAFAVVVAFPYLPGSQSPAFKGISIFLGVLLSLGSSSTVSNIIAGLDMTYRRAFVKGDWVKIGDLTGEVTRIRLLVTHLKSYKNEEVVIPNAVIQNSHVTNYSSMAREQGLILHTTVTIGYNTPWRQVHAFLLKAAEKTRGLLRDPAPFILQTGLDDFYVRYELNAYTDSPHDMPDIYSELHLNIQDAFNEYGVQIMSPHYIDDPASPAIVPKERWYEPPARPPGDVVDG